MGGTGPLCYKFAAEPPAERILQIGLQLAMLQQKQKCPVYWLAVRCTKHAVSSRQQFFITVNVKYYNLLADHDNG